MIRFPPSLRMIGAILESPAFFAVNNTCEMTSSLLGIVTSPLSGILD